MSSPQQTAAGMQLAASPTLGQRISGAAVVALLMTQLGKPYGWDTPVDPGTQNPNSFDCSGLAQWAYDAFGVQISHYSPTQQSSLAQRPLADAQPGDLVFYADSTGFIHHTAIYAGNGNIISADDYGLPVRVESMLADGTPLNTVGAFPGVGTGPILPNGAAILRQLGSGATTPTTTNNAQPADLAVPGGGILGGVLGDATSGAMSDAFNFVVGPVLNFIENASLVFFGTVFVIVALIIVAKSSSNSSSGAQMPENPSSRKSGEDEGADPAAAPVEPAVVE